MSSQIAPGMRGVSATITAESASGGFVQPNDRVDVILTRGQGELQTSEIILRDVRVIAIDTNTIEGAGGKDEAGTPEPEVGKDTPAAFVNIALATFELDPARAQVLINATMVGKLSVVLRAAGETPVAAMEGESAANQAIRLSSPFWRN
jgi:pilus assembly protein CpaB